MLVSLHSIWRSRMNCLHNDMDEAAGATVFARKVARLPRKCIQKYVEGQK